MVSIPWKGYWDRLPPMCEDRPKMPSQVLDDSQDIHYAYTLGSLHHSVKGRVRSMMMMMKEKLEMMMVEQRS